jgi:hypothetical protein
MTMIMSRSDWEALEPTIRARAQGLFSGPSSLTGGVAMIAGCRIQVSDLIPAGRALLLEPGRPPAAVPVSAVLTYVTARTLAGVDERVGA